MIRKKVVLALMLVLSVLLGCGHITASSNNNDLVNTAEGSVEPVDSWKDEGNPQAGENTGTDSEFTDIETPVTEKSLEVIDHDDPDDFIWDSEDVTNIMLSDQNVSVDGTGVTVGKQIVTITSAGTYNLEGTLQEGQLIIDTDDDGIVRLILNGVDINNSVSSPLYIISADKTVIILADNSENYFTDSSIYEYENQDETEPNAAIFSHDDLVIGGEGTLIVTGQYNDGIASKDGLLIQNGYLQISAVDDGIRGKDYLVIQDAFLTITAGGDALKSDNTEDTSVGYITIENSSIDITSGGDALEAESDIHIVSGQMNLVTTDSSRMSLGASTSAKGIKGINSVLIDEGTFTISTTDDAIHSNNFIIINGGTFEIATGDDGLHADASITINDGQFVIEDSYEGIESAVITINAGTFHITSSDDGLNVVGGNDGSGMEGMARMPGRGRGPMPNPGDRFNPGAAPGQDDFTYTGEYYLNINGGYIVINARGDGMDINGAVEMTDGLVIINGPTENFNGALDYNASFTITGGTLIAVGSAGMAQVPGAQSTQNSVLVNLNSMVKAGTLVHIQSSDGTDILTFIPTKPFQSIAFSSPGLVNGDTYDVYLGGNAEGTSSDGLYENASYTPGTKYTSFTVSGAVTQLRNR